MPQKIDAQKAREQLDQLTAIALSDDLNKALQKVGKDKALLAKVTANPKAFLKAQGFTLPANSQVEMKVRRPPSQVQVGLPKPKRVLELCVMHHYVFGTGEWRHEADVVHCKKYFIF